MNTIPARSRRRRRWPWIALAAIMLSTVLGFGFYASRTEASSRQTLSPDDIDLRLGKAETADIQVTVTEVGTIEPLVKVDVKSALSGRIVDLAVREGARVKKGQVLAQVEPDVNQAQTLSAVQSAVNMATIKARDAEKDLDTHTRLHEEGLISDLQLKDFQVELDTAQEELEAARTKTRIVEESGIPLGSEISTTRRVNVVSPMDGVIIKKNVEIGQTVMSGVSSFNEGTIIYTVADLGSMLIKAAINEVDIGRIRLEMPVVVTVDAFPYRRFEGEVTHISPAARLQEKIKVFDVEVGLAEQVADFRAGMTANIDVKGEQVEDTLSVPVEGIFKKEDRNVVYVLRSPFADPKEGERSPRKTRSGKYDISEIWQQFFEERDVKVGLAGLEKAQILEGMTEGIQVALEDPTRPREIEED